jgi:mercuric ion binding protein
LEPTYSLDVSDYVGRRFLRGLYCPAIAYWARYLACKELVVKLMPVLMTVLMLWGTSVVAAETHILLGVDGMSCPFCVYGIEKQLKKIDDVGEVRVDLAQGEIWVETTGTDVLSEEDARLLLENAGFTLRSFEVHQPGDHEPEKNESGQHE